MVSKSLKEVVLKPITGEWGTEGDNVQILRTTNFTNEGRVNYLKVVERNVDSNKIEKKKLKIGDIIIEKSGGSPKQPVGRVVFFEKEGVFLCNNFTAILRPKVDEVVPKYLLYILYCNHKFGFTSAYQNKTTGIINLQLPKYLEGTKIPLPTLDQQKKIAAILDAADAYRQKTKALITKYDELKQSLFLDMFGDSSIFEHKLISEIASDKKYSLSSGPFGSNLTSKHYTESGIIILRGTNVTSGTLDLSNVKYVSEEKATELKRSELKPGDVVVVAVGSSGKALRIPDNLNRAIMSQNFNKISPNKKIVTSLYLEFCFNSQLVQNQFKREMTDTVRTFLSLTKIKGVSIPVPPLELQNLFAERVQAIETQKAQAQASLARAEDLFNSLLQRAFKGELVN